MRCSFSLVRRGTPSSQPSPHQSPASQRAHDSAGSGAREVQPVGPPMSRSTQAALSAPLTAVRRFSPPALPDVGDRPARLWLPSTVGVGHCHFDSSPFAAHACRVGVSSRRSPERATCPPLGTIGVGNNPEPITLMRRSHFGCR